MKTYVFYGITMEVYMIAAAAGGMLLVIVLLAYKEARQYRRSEPLRKKEESDIEQLDT